jgi:hypothetical protein
MVNKKLEELSWVYPEEVFTNLILELIQKITLSTLMFTRLIPSFQVLETQSKEDLLQEVKREISDFIRKVVLLEQILYCQEWERK